MPSTAAGTTSPLNGFHPVVRDWFLDRFDSPTQPQREGWPAIAAGRDVLVTAPTGSGKTLAAFLSAIDAAARDARTGALRDETRVVYVSPLRALSADIRANLETPLAEIRERAALPGAPPLPEIRAALRTGDTPSAERARMTRRPPHLLITTPESLYLLLTSPRGRALLAPARTVIVDEIHALARDKRGSHLALTLERLDRAAGRRLQRIGLSATVKPVSEIASFLSPRAGGPEVVAVGGRRRFDLGVEVPGTELGAVASHEVMEDIRNRIADLIGEHRTTLVFVNTRRLAERMTHELRERLGADAVLAHHGSLARDARLEAERRLRAGEVSAMVATASLELGIDIGTVELVCQLGSPRSLSAAVQRIGRSGHWRGATPKGRIFPTTRDELVECAALAEGLGGGELDALRLPKAPLDILAQQVVAEAGATADEPWPLDDLFDFVRGAYPFRGLDRAAFDEVIAMLAEGVATTRGRRTAFLHRDSVNGTVRGRRGARLAATLNGGAIPETAQYQVVAEPEDRVVGQVDEDFAVESYRGDVFLLGTTAWRIRRIAQGQVRVEDARGAAPTIPFWRGEAPGRTAELSERVGRLREEVAEADEAAARRRLVAECRLTESGADQVVRYLAAGRAVLGAVPGRRTVVAERFFDETGGMQLVLHAPFGSRVNRAWGLALRKRFCRSFDLELQAAATDDGVNLSLTDLHSFELASVFRFLNPETLKHTLTQAVLGAPLFEIRWRHTVSRALAVPRRRGGRKVPPPIQRMLADDLLAAVFPDQAACAENLAGEVRVPKHPLVDEALAEALEETLDRDGLREVLRAVAAGEIRTLAVDSAEASPFAAEILNANPFAFLDPAPLEERRARAVRMRRALPPELDAEAVLDPEAIARAEAEARLRMRDADEAHDALLTLGALREDPAGTDWPEPGRPEPGALLEQLERDGRAFRFSVPGAVLWTAAERIPLARRVWPDADLPEERRSRPLPAAKKVPESRAAATAEVLRGALDCSGPRTVAELAAGLALREKTAADALALLEAEGTVLRGSFRPPGPEVSGTPPTEEWCHRRVLARIHRLTLAGLRRESAPVSAARFLDFLVSWQHAAPASRLHGPAGVSEALAQLQGLEAPAAAWESQLLPLRVAGYRRDWLDRNCLSGETVWGRVSPPAAGASPTRPAPRAARPTRSAPIALLPRRALDLWLHFGRTSEERVPLGAAAETVLSLLERRGASFFADLERASGLVPAEIEDALWELAAAGRVTADGFDNLRALMDPRRRSAFGRYRRRKARYSPGRWAPLAPLSPEAPEVLADAGNGAALSPTDRDEEAARRLLDRWGVLFRELLKRERLEGRWRPLQLALRRLEMRGEVVGGQFVSTFPGEQFALPAAVDALRRLRRDGDGPATAEPLTIGPADPLNLSGILIPGPRIPASSRGLLRLHRGTITAAPPGASLSGLPLRPPSVGGGERPNLAAAARA